MSRTIWKSKNLDAKGKSASPPDRRSDKHVTASLTGDFIVEAAESTSEVFTAYIAGKFQAGITSSLTIWRRITLGFSVASKWQETASRIIVFSSSRVSASVKMEKPSARA